MNKTLHFLSGLPRSGSTVLAAILNQNKDIHVTTTSGLVFALDGLANTWHGAPLLHENDLERAKLANVMRGVITNFYDTDKPFILDKSRGWPIPVIMSAMKQVLNRKPKIIATVRNVPDCMASFVRVAKPKNLDEFITNGQLSVHLQVAYQTLKAGYEHDPSCFLFVEYENLLSNPKNELKKIHQFLGLADFDYNFENIDGTSVKEDDENLHGYVGMHDIKPKLEPQHHESAQSVLKHYYNQFCQPEFWLPSPKTFPKIDDLDLQLTASTMGRFEDGKKLADKLKRERPHDYRATFNRGWYELMDGNFEEGHRLLYSGRKIGVFGNSHIQTNKPEWNGEPKKTILLYLEGGYGDQIHQLGYIRYLRKKQCSIIVVCSEQLTELVYNSKLADVVIQHGAENKICYDAWIAGMSAPVYLKLRREEVLGDSYIPLPQELYPKKKKLRIGLRWSGNKKFEEQHHKLFPAHLFFDSVKRKNVEFISLQRDADLELMPKWVKKVPLDTWTDTQKAIASCDLVISSCTSVSHLSAAMGIPTWVIIPIMAYYLYAEPGDKTPYYNSMRLFRQQVYNDWTHPFEQIKRLNYHNELLSCTK